jgi:hypothetical protein
MRQLDYTNMLEYHNSLGVKIKFEGGLIKYVLLYELLRSAWISLGYRSFIQKSDQYAGDWQLFSTTYRAFRGYEVKLR